MTITDKDREASGPFRIEAESERLETMYEYRVVRPNGVGGSASYGSVEDAQEEVELLSEGYELGLVEGYKRAIRSVMDNPDHSPDSLAFKLREQGREEGRAELDAERAAHAETKARLALAEKWAAFGSACFDAFWSDGDPCDLDAGDTQERALAHGVLRHRTEGDDTLDVDANNCCGFCPCVTDNAPLSECECLFPTLAAWRAAK